MSDKSELCRFFPETWGRGRFGTLFTESRETNGAFPAEQALSVSEYHGVMKRNDSKGQVESADVSSYRVVRPGQLAANVMWLNRTGLGVSNDTGYVSPAYKVFDISEHLHPGFVNYLIRSDLYRAQFEKMGRGVRPNAQMVDSSHLRAMFFPEPPLTTQRTIADYLDRETAQIDTLVSEQERLIDLLRERRASVAEQALTAYEWSVPLHSTVSLIQTGPFGSQVKSEEYVLGGTPLINPSHMLGSRVVPDPGVAVEAAKAVELRRHALRDGDLIVARRGELGRCAVVDRVSAGALCGTGSALVRPNNQVLDVRFLALVFSSRRVREALELASVGSTMSNLNASILAALRIPVPRLTEQVGVTTAVGEQTAKIDQLITEAERFIELARERRSALITAAVTGQIEIPEAS